MNIHATAIALGALGVLIEGPSGSGKTSLALAALEKMQSQNRFAALVADDQCMIEAVHGRLIAACPPALSGLAEIRGLGVVTIQNLPAIVIDLVVCLVDQAEITRMPESKFLEISGVRLPCFDLPARQIAVSLPILMEILENRRV